MSVSFEQRLCGFCLTRSDIETAQDLEAAGWSEVFDVEGWLDRCPECTLDAEGTDDE